MQNDINAVNEKKKESMAETIEKIYLDYRC